METIGVDAAKLAGLQIDLLQKLRAGQVTIEQIEWFNLLSKDERDRLMKESKFALINTFRFTVPADYKHDTQLATVDRSQFRYGVNDAITDANFAKATQRLVPGKTYEVKIFGILRRVTSQECLGLYQSQNGIKTGAQGISLVHQQAKEQLPIGKWTASFDDEEALPLLGGGRGAPYVSRDSGGDFGFGLGYFEHDWGFDSCLLVFCDEPLGA